MVFNQHLYFNSINEQINTVAYTCYLVLLTVKIANFLIGIDDETRDALI